MPNAALPPYTFTHVRIHLRNHVHVGAVDDKLADDNLDHAIIFRYLDGTWAKKSLGSAVVASETVMEPGLKLVNLTANGEAAIFLFPGDTTETLDPSDEGPSDLLTMRTMRSIGGRLYAAGMARRVYRREAPDTWVAIDQGVFVPRAQRKRAVGFNAIDGRSGEEIYAVGYKGEIWYYDGHTWRQEDSPTNVALNGVVALPDGEVYACGLAGVIVAGHAGQWRAIPQDVTSEDFWGISAFLGRIYLSSYDGVFRLDGDTLTRVDMALNRPVSTAYLDARDGVLWSVGQKDIAMTADGAAWAIVPKR